MSAVIAIFGDVVLENVLAECCTRAPNRGVFMQYNHQGHVITVNDLNIDTFCKEGLQHVYDHLFQSLSGGRFMQKESINYFESPPEKVWLSLAMMCISKSSSPREKVYPLFVRDI